jgi:hypothetical protein
VTKAEPQIRAAQSQSLLAAAERLGPSERHLVFDRTGPTALEAIRSPLPISWVSMAHHMKLAVSIHGVLGRRRNIDLWQRTMVDAFRRPFLRGFVNMTTSLLGLRPSSLLKRSGTMYEHVTRNVGVVSFELQSEREGEAELRGFPAAEFDFACYVDGLQGCIEATFTICNTAGRVDVIETIEQRGDVRYHIAWD